MVFLLWHGYLQLVAEEVAGAEVLQHCVHLQRYGRVDGEGVALLNENFEKLAGVGIQHLPQGRHLCKPELAAILDSTSAAEVLVECGSTVGVWPALDKK